MTARTLYDKVWDSTSSRPTTTAASLLYIDRHLVQEVSSPQAFAGLIAGGPHAAPADSPYRRRRSCGADPLPQPAAAGRAGGTPGVAARAQLRAIRHPLHPDARRSARHRPRHRPGARLHACRVSTLVCGDSHTSTHGAFGAIAFGIGASECECVFATQTLRQRKQKTHARHPRRRAAGRCRRQGHHPRADRADRHQWRRRLRDRICRPGDRRRCRWKRA